MKEIYVLRPCNISQQLHDMIEAALSGNKANVINSHYSLKPIRNSKIIFAAELDNCGMCIPLYKMLSVLKEFGDNSLSGSEGIILVRSSGELYTKDAAQNIVFTANSMGCSFIGHPLVEATGSLSNFLTWQKTINMPLWDICIEQCKRLGQRFLKERPALLSENPKLLALHASSRETSNTLQLWYMVKKHICHIETLELHVENGQIEDCNGCSYKTCIHYSKQSSCFYGGVMVKEILPAIETADAVVWICPNYNDAVSANLTAVINRLTALYRKVTFYEKSLFAVVVSGNSGSDSVAKQLIGALNINKGFRLPPHFAIMATANDAGAIFRVNDISNLAIHFAENINAWIK